MHQINIHLQGGPGVDKKLVVAQLDKIEADILDGLSHHTSRSPAVGYTWDACEVDATLAYDLLQPICAGREGCHAQ